MESGKSVPVPGENEPRQNQAIARNPGVGLTGQVLVHPSHLCQIGGLDQGRFGLSFRSSIRRLLKSQQSKSNDRQLFGLSEFLEKIDTASTLLRCVQSDLPEVF
jgi:hypothetical protein